MKLSYEFNKHIPPHLTEHQLNEIIKNRQIAARALILVAASYLIHICLILTAFALAPYSFKASIVCLIILGLLLWGSSIIALLLSRKLKFNYRSDSSLGLSLDL